MNILTGGIKLKPHMKAVISNQFVEVTQQSFLPQSKRTSSGGRKTYSIQNNENYNTNLKISINRAHKQIRRLLECNFNKQYAFLTLTFAPTNEFDITDIKSCNERFRTFKKRLMYYLQKNQLPNFKYLGVIEFQENRQGAIHYHLVCNLLEVPTDVLQELWQYGGIHKATISSDPTQNEKITYYLNKGISDPRLNGYKRYMHSQGLKKPIILDVEDPTEFYNLLDGCQSTLKQSSTFLSPFTGETKYEQYYINNSKELINYVQEL